MLKTKVGHQLSCRIVIKEVSSALMHYKIRDKPGIETAYSEEMNLILSAKLVMFKAKEI